MAKKKKERKCFKRLCILTGILFVFGSVYLTSFEYTLHVKEDKLKNEMRSLQADIDSLDMQIYELTEFSRILAVTKEHGFSYQNHEVATIVSVHNNQ